MNYNNINARMKTMKLKTMAMAVVSALVMTTGCSKNEEVNPLLGSYQLITFEVEGKDYIQSISSNDTKAFTLNIGDKFNFGNSENRVILDYSTNNNKLNLSGNLDKSLLKLNPTQDYKVTKDSLIISNVKVQDVKLKYHFIRK